LPTRPLEASILSSRRQLSKGLSVTASLDIGHLMFVYACLMIQLKGFFC
jgi:hypothetical protein